MELNEAAAAWRREVVLAVQGVEEYFLEAGDAVSDDAAPAGQD